MTVDSLIQLPIWIEVSFFQLTMSCIQRIWTSNDATFNWNILFQFVEIAFILNWSFFLNNFINQIIQWKCYQGIPLVNRWTSIFYNSFVLTATADSNEWFTLSKRHHQDEDDWDEDEIHFSFQIHSNQRKYWCEVFLRENFLPKYIHLHPHDVLNCVL